VHRIINDAAQVYKGVIQMIGGMSHICRCKSCNSKIHEGVEFWGYELDGELVASWESKTKAT